MQFPGRLLFQIVLLPSENGSTLKGKNFLPFGCTVKRKTFLDTQAASVSLLI